jgi:hypothetical protein
MHYKNGDYITADGPMSYEELFNNIKISLLNAIEEDNKIMIKLLAKNLYELESSEQGF